MTKYVLNSGGLRNHPEKGKSFLAEIVEGLGSHPHMLVVLFAQPREDWEKKFVQDENELNAKAPPGVTLSFELAFPDTFAAQVKESDIIYVHGGDDHLLHYWFSKYDLPALWGGKVVATSSAGSNVLVEHYWTCDWRQCLDGLGLLPIKFISHYKSDFGSDDPKRGPIDWQGGYDELANYKNTELPIHALEEGDYVVIEQ